MKQVISSDEKMHSFGHDVARHLQGGEIIELVGDVGAGKTTFVKGLAHGLGVKEIVQSPSFTLFARYDASNGKSLHHYDFYRLEEPGLVAYDLAESLADPQAVTVVEWGDTVRHVLPDQHIVIRFTVRSETQRELAIEGLSL